MRRYLVGMALLAILVTSAFLPAAASDSARSRVSDQGFLQRIDAVRDPARSADPASDAAGPAAPASVDSFEVLGHERLLKDEAHGDVFFYDHGGTAGKYAYVGSWQAFCAGTGVNVINVNEPTDPRLVGVVGSHHGESHHDVVVRRIGDRDVMAVGVERCGRDGRSGVEFFDVTNPKRAVWLSFVRTPQRGVNELDLVVQPGGRALALLAVPELEFHDTYLGADRGGEFRIVDITHPRRPKEVADWGLIADASIPIPSGTRPFSSTFQGLGNFAEVFAHSVRAADHGMTAYVSWWDAGVLKVDISDPENPKLVGRTVFPVDAEGEGHSVTTYEVGGDRYILQHDEDVDVTPIPTFESSATGDKVFAGIEEPWAPTHLYEVGSRQREVFDAGDGCAPRDFDGAAGAIALADSVDPFYVGIIDGWGPVPCTVGRQVVLAARAGAAAFVSNLVSPDNGYPYFRGNFDLVASEAEGMPIIQISDIDEEALAIRRRLAQGATVTARLTPGTPSWGFLRVFSEATGSDADGDGVVEYDQVGSFDDLPYVTGTLDAPLGQWSIHNTEVLGDRGYSSWYSHGIVALDLTDPANPVRVGQFVPHAGRRFKSVLGPPFPYVWGVAVDPETGIVYASDIRSGLWIVKPTGAAAAS